MRTIVSFAALIVIFSAGSALAGSDKLTKIMGFGGVCSDCNLSKKNLSGAKMNGASFPRSNFTAADLSSAELSGSNFSRAIFRRADLSSSTVSGSNFSWADFSGATLDAMKGNGNNFSRATLNGAKGREADFMATNFSYAKMLGVTFEDAQFEYSNFSNANLSGAKLRNSRFEMSNLAFADLSAADLRDAEFTRVDFRNTKFGSSSLKNTMFTEVFLVGADLSKVRGLNEEQLASSCGNAQTKLPSGFSLKDCTIVSWAKEFGVSAHGDESFAKAFFVELSDEDIANIREETRRTVIEGRKILMEAGRALAEAFEEAERDDFQNQWDEHISPDSPLAFQRQERSLVRVVRSLNRLKVSSAQAQQEIDQAILNLEKARYILNKQNKNQELAEK